MKSIICVILTVAIVSTQGRHVELRQKRQSNTDVGNRFLFPDAFGMMSNGPSDNNRGDEFENFGNGNGNGMEFGDDMLIDPFNQNQQGANQGANQGGANQGGANQGINQGGANQGGVQRPTTTAAPTTTSQPPRVKACIARCPVTSEFSPICGSNGILYFNLSNFNCAVKCGVDVRQMTRSNCP